MGDRTDQHNSDEQVRAREMSRSLGILGNLVGAPGAIEYFCSSFKPGTSPVAAPTQPRPSGANPVATTVAVLPPQRRPPPSSKNRREGSPSQTRSRHEFSEVAPAAVGSRGRGPGRGTARCREPRTEPALEARADDAAKRLAEATAQAALEASKNRKLAAFASATQR